MCVLGTHNTSRRTAIGTTPRSTRSSSRLLGIRHTQAATGSTLKANAALAKVPTLSSGGNNPMEPGRWLRSSSQDRQRLAGQGLRRLGGPRRARGCVEALRGSYRNGSVPAGTRAPPRLGAAPRSRCQRPTARCSRRRKAQAGGPPRSRAGPWRDLEGRVTPPGCPRREAELLSWVGRVSGE